MELILLLVGFVSGLAFSRWYWYDYINEGGQNDRH